MTSSMMRKRAWRLKIKQDPVKYEMYKEKDRVRKKAKPSQVEERSDNESTMVLPSSIRQRR